MDRFFRTNLAGKHGRILRIVYAALSTASTVGIAIALGSLMVRNPREAAIICGCVAVIAITRLDIATMAADKDKGPDRR